ncbi:MAG: hypothetical protein U1F98_14290 [Verrucomicrobiota bacterium]
MSSNLTAPTTFYWGFQRGQIFLPVSYTDFGAVTDIIIIPIMIMTVPMVAMGAMVMDSGKVMAIIIRQRSAD